MTRLNLAAVAAVLSLAIGGCSSGSSDGGEDLGDASLSTLQTAIDDGRGCADLIEIKNNMDPKSSDYEAAPDMLRSVGCFSTTSERTD